MVDITIVTYYTGTIHCAFGHHLQLKCLCCDDDHNRGDDVDDDIKQTD